MEERIKFKKGDQRKFFNHIIYNLNCESLRGILQFGFEIPYSTLKNYYTERRLMPESFFLNLCQLAKIDKNSLNVKYYNRFWGQIKGGKRKKVR